MFELQLLSFFALIVKSFSDGVLAKKAPATDAKNRFSTTCIDCVCMFYN